MELDVYLPKENLAFEYHGQQHYYDLYALGNLWIQRELDREKKKACQDQGIVLIEVPYWWDFQKPSLIATIHKDALHLAPFKGEGDPILHSPPKGFPKGSGSFLLITSSGLVSELMLAEEWDGMQDLQGW